jgi:hypothetical protein
MAEKDAKVRLNLAASGFATQLQELQKHAAAFEKELGQIAPAADKAEKKLGSFGQVGKAALGGVKQSLSELGSSLKSTLTQAATLGGALSLGVAAKAGMDLVKTYRDIANSIEAGTGAATSWKDVQSSIEGTAARWKQSNGDVAASYKKLWDEVGDAKFASAGIESVARAARGGYGSVAALTDIVGVLNEKFEVPASGIDDALASVIALGNKGGANVEQLGEKLGILGATAKEAGFTGEAGLRRMLGMLNSADNVTGNFRKSLKAVTGIFDTLVDPEKMKNIGKELKIGLVDKKTGKPFAHALEMIIGKSGGKQEILAKVFSGEELKLVTEFGKTYAKAFESTKGDIQTKTRAGLAAYNEALEKASKSTLSASKVDEEAKQRLADQDAQITDAMRKLEVAFTDPKMVAGLTKLAEVAPKVAEALAKLLGFAVDHPKTAAGALVGGTVLKGLAAGALPAVGKIALKFLKGGAAAAEGAAAAGAGTGAAEASGAGAAAETGAGAAVAGVAIPAAIVTAGIGLAYGARQLDKRTDDLDKTYDAMGMPVTTDMATSGDEQRAAKRARANMLTAPGALPNAFDWAPTASSAPAATPAQQPAGRAQKEMVQLEQSSKKASTAVERTASMFDRLATSAERLDSILNRTSSGDPGTNGLPGTPGNQSGSAP